MKTKILRDHIEEKARKIVDAAFVVHKELGPGLLERVYVSVFVMS